MRACRIQDQSDSICPILSLAGRLMAYPLHIAVLYRTALTGPMIQNAQSYAFPPASKPWCRNFRIIGLKA